MKVDMLNFVALADQSLGLPFSRQTHAKCANPDNPYDRGCDIITPIDPVSGYGQWKHVKNAQGWPWDIKLYDANWVYDWVTEKDWVSGPKSFKKFVRNHTSPPGIVGDGMIEYPRMVDGLSTNFVMSIPAAQTMYATFEDCKQVGPPVSLGAVKQQLRGPFLIEHGGDVGLQPTFVHQYFWSDMVGTIRQIVPTLEENYYAMHYGWVAWRLLMLNDKSGMYEPIQSTVCNRLVESKPAIQFPCF